MTMTLPQAGKKLRGLYRGGFRGIKVLQRGASPRIMRALVRGTRGSTEVNGATLRQKLELFDTWAYFTSVTAKASRAPAGAHASTVRERVLTGTVTPARRGSIATVQVLRGGRWFFAGSAWIGSRGAYRWPVVKSGTYRVVYADAPGPAIRFN